MLNESDRNWLLRVIKVFSQIPKFTSLQFNIIVNSNIFREGFFMQC